MPTVIRKSASVVERRRMILHSVDWQVQVRPHVWSPPTDMYETETDYVVRVEIAGMCAADFSVSIADNYLVISGARPDTPKRRAYRQMEIRFGEFSAALELPAPVDVDRASAEYADGFLFVTLPKARPSQVHVQE